MKVRSFLGWTLGCMSLSSLVVVGLTEPAQTRPRENGELAGAQTPENPAAADQTRFDLGGAVKISARLGHQALSQAGGKTYALFELEAGELSAAQGGSAPIDLVLVVDRSGSMKGQRMDNARAAARAALARLRDGDSITVVAYDSSAHQVVGPLQVGAATRQVVDRALGKITARGNTCISCALEHTLDLPPAASNAVRHVILLSDGQPTAGVMETAGFMGLARRARNRAMAISSIGIDVDYNEQLLSALAAQSNGEHYFVENPSRQLVGILDREVSKLVKAAARGVRLQLSLPEGVELVKVFDRQFERQGNRLTVDFGHFTPGDKKTLLVELRGAPGAGTLPLVAAQISYDDLVQGSQQTLDAVLAAPRVDGDQVGELDPVVAARIASSETASLLRGANTLFAQGDLAGVEKKIDAQLKALDEVQARAGGSGKANSSLDAQRAEIEKSKKKWRKSRGTKCACPPGDLMCAMRCTGPADSKSEKASNKSAMESSNPFSR